jgi:hypothetical protein
VPGTGKTECLYGSWHLSAPGAQALTAAATYSYQDNQGSGSQNNGGSSSVSGSSPGPVVNFALPDSGVVPVASAVQQTGADRQQAAAGGGGGGAAGSSAPVAAAVSLQLVTNVGSWMSVTGKGVQASVHATSNVQASVTSDLYGFTLANQEKWALVAPMARGLNFGVTAWNALRPVFGLVERFSGGFGVEHQVQGLLAQTDPTGGVATVFSHASVAPNSGDPYVQWVDGMLANNGQPLTAGSAPIYGTYMDGTEALVFCGGVKIASGVFFVAEGTVAALAGGPVGIGLGLTSVWMGANSIGDGLMALAAAQPNPGQSQGLTAQQALSQAAPAVAAGAELVGTWWMVGPSLLPLRPFSVGGSGSGASWDGALGRGEQRLAELRQGGALTEAGGFSASEIMAADPCWAAGACFAAGTPLLTPEGARAIEEFRPGDLVLSRDQFKPLGAVVARQVLQTFVRSASIWHVHVRDQVIGTTKEHPFYVLGRGWRAVSELRVGNAFLSDDGQWVVVEDLLDTGDVQTVYNLQIADDHTYFVGSVEWGFSVWAHNANYRITTETRIRQLQEMEARPVNPDAAAEELGYQRTSSKSHGQPVYYNAKTGRYITPDVDSHIGGVWKMADSIRSLGSKRTRLGTFDADLKWIGE